MLAQVGKNTRWVSGGGVSRRGHTRQATVKPGGAMCSYWPAQAARRVYANIMPRPARTRGRTRFAPDTTTPPHPRQAFVGGTLPGNARLEIRTIRFGAKRDFHLGKSRPGHRRTTWASRRARRSPTTNGIDASGLRKARAQMGHFGVRASIRRVHFGGSLTIIRPERQRGVNGF